MGIFPNNESERLPDLDGLGFDFDCLPDDRTTDEKDRAEATNLKIRSRSIHTAGQTLDPILAETVQQACTLIKAPPKPGEYIHLVVCKDFGSFDLLPAIFHLTGARTIDRLYVCTLGISTKNLDTTTRLLQKRILNPDTLKVLISRYYVEYERWKDAAEKWGFGYRNSRNHTKLINAKIGDNHFCIEGSANMRGCMSIEQYAITNSQKLFDFHAQWIEELWPKADY